MAEDITLNMTINEAENGFIVFVTPKYLENAGDRCFVAKDPESLGQAVRDLAMNTHPDTGDVLEWPAKMKDGDFG